MLREQLNQTSQQTVSQRRDSISRPSSPKLQLDKLHRGGPGMKRVEDLWKEWGAR